MSADSNTSKLAGQREVTWATALVSPALKLIRLTSENLAHKSEKVRSEEVRGDRQITDLAHVGDVVGGAINFELSYTDWLEYFEAALATTKTTLAISATSSAAVSTQRITAGSGTPFVNVIPGCSIRVAGFVTAANNGIKRVLAVGSGGLYITLLAGSLTTDESAVAITVGGVHMANGLTPPSYVFERGIRKVDTSYVYQKFIGCTLDELALKIESKKIITGSASFVGQVGTPESGPSNSYGAASTDSVMTASVNVASFEKDGASMSEKMKQFDFSIKNGLRGKDCIAQSSIFEVGVGTCEVTGTLNAYFRDNALFTAFRNNSEIALGFVVTDAEGNSICIYFPRVKLADANPAITGQNADVMQSCPFTALVGEGAFTQTIYVSFVPATN